MSAKASLRGKMSARRDAMTAGERERYARSLAAVLAALPQYAGARSVLATMSIGSEVSTRPFLERARADGKSIVLPRVTAERPRRLRLHEVAELDRDLVPGVWDIPEPDPQRCREVELGEVDFAWIPALAVDPAGFRLGYGGGFFDKLLAGRGARPYCVAAVPAAFLVQGLPHEPHDVAVDLVLTAP